MGHKAGLFDTTGKDDKYYWWFKHSTGTFPHRFLIAALPEALQLSKDNQVVVCLIALPHTTTAGREAGKKAAPFQLLHAQTDVQKSPVMSSAQLKIQPSNHSGSPLSYILLS